MMSAQSSIGKESQVLVVPKFSVGLTCWESSTVIPKNAGGMTPVSLLTKAVPQDVKTLDSTTTDNETRSCLRVQAIFNQAPIACKAYSTGDRAKIPLGWMN